MALNGIQSMQGGQPSQSLNGMSALQNQQGGQQKSSPWKYLSPLLSAVLPQEWKQGIGDFIFGTPSSIQGIPNFDESQLQLLQMLLGGAGEQLQNPYAGFDPLAQEAMSDFEQRGLPALAEQFTSLGSNKISSPAFASQAGQARAGLSERLAAMKSLYGMQNRQQGLQQAGLALSPKNQNFSVPGQPGALGPILNAAAQAGTKYATGGMF